jgi:hypothetical protein
LVFLGQIYETIDEIPLPCQALMVEKGVLKWFVWKDRKWKDITCVSNWKGFWIMGFEMEVFFVSWHRCLCSLIFMICQRLSENLI